MTRSGYAEEWGDDYPNQIGLYRASVERSISGKRGQKFLRQLAEYMDAMPKKRLIKGNLVSQEGECCAIGVFCKAKQIDVSNLDIYDPKEVGKAVGLSRAMAAEIEYLNDNDFGYEAKNESPEDRWKRMRKWVAEQIEDTPLAALRGEK